MHFILTALLATQAFALDWAAPEPKGFHSRGYGHVAEIFPPNSRQNKTDKPISYFYSVDFPGSDWMTNTELLWKGELANEKMPNSALISKAGHFVTLNEKGSIGFKNSIVIYNQKGKLIKSYSIDELLPKSALKQIPTAGSFRWWNKEARYFFLTNPGRLYIVLRWERVLKFFLKNGEYLYGSEKTFPDLERVIKKPYTDEEAEIWSLNLRFSSITDVNHAKRSVKTAKKKRKK